jgi:hypothetical protein
MTKTNSNASTVAVAAVAATAVTTPVTIDGKEVQVPTDEAMRAAGMISLSARIRHLSGLGVKTGPIAKIVKRSNGAHPLYQHVRNVLNTPLKASTPAAETA